MNFIKFPIVLASSFLYNNFLSQKQYINALAELYWPELDFFFCFVLFLHNTLTSEYSVPFQQQLEFCPLDQHYALVQSMLPPLNNTSKNYNKIKKISYLCANIR